MHFSTVFNEIGFFEMELLNQAEPVHTIKRQYIHLDDVLPPLETLVVTIEGSCPLTLLVSAVSFNGRLGKE